MKRTALGRWWRLPALTLCALGAWACHDARRAQPQPAASKLPVPVSPSAPAVPIPSVVAVAPEPELPVSQMHEPVPLWEHGQLQRQIDAASASEHGYLVLDLGESWAPYLFSDGSAANGKPLSNAYRSTYLALARGEFPEDLHGERAKHDKYLELYGIPPTLSVLRERMMATARLTCAEGLDLAPLQSFTGLVTYSDQPTAKREAARFDAAKSRTLELLQAQGVSAPEQLDPSKLGKKDAAQVALYIKGLPQVHALEALQARLKCEGYLAGRGKIIAGVMDWATHESLAEYERQHRVFSFGYLGRDSLTPLRQPPLDVDRESVLRVLTERAVHAAGVLEDGSVEAATYKGRDGRERPVPNLVAQLQDGLVDAFGLQAPENTLGWLASLGELPAGEHRYVAIRRPALPEYYGPEMELTLDYDRGDVWYDFPYDDKGQEIPQPVSRRPQVTVSTLYEGQKIALARFGTTIGGWRSELIDGTVMWKYKGSPVGQRAWQEIVAAPVWLPPDGTPPEALLNKNPQRKLPTDPEYVLNLHEVGPSYASAYGLVAAYHRTFVRRPDGRILLGMDEGIRTHGSVDYMSIMRRHSHGCHRLHNHIALRLMSFVLAHRAHERLGQEQVGYRRYVPYKGQSYLLDIPLGGYTFKLTRPLIVNVEEGRIRGKLKQPIELAIPEYNSTLRAYVMPDGTAVRVRGAQLVPTTLPPPAAAPKPLASALLTRTAPRTNAAPPASARWKPSRSTAVPKTAIATRPRAAGAVASAAR